MKKFLDHIGIVLSCTCALHCLALPILLVLTQIDLEFEGFHEAMIAMTAIVSGQALWHGFKEHCRHIVFTYGGLGLFCMIIALFGTEAFEIALTTAGGLLIVAAHVLNLRCRKSCCVNTETETGVCHETHD